MRLPNAHIFINVKKKNLCQEQNQQKKKNRISKKKNIVNYGKKKKVLE